jgi:chemotaxis signal transduction protein
VDVIVFRLGERRFGLELSHVREVLRLGRVTPVPLTPPTLIGAMHVRGQVLPVIDLACVFGEGSARATLGATCLRAHDGLQQLLLHVGRVEEVLQLDEDVAVSGALGLVRGTLTTSRGDLPLLDLGGVIEKVSSELDSVLANLRSE